MWWLKQAVQLFLLRDTAIPNARVSKLKRDILIKKETNSNSLYGLVVRYSVWACPVTLAKRFGVVLSSILSGGQPFAPSNVLDCALGIFFVCLFLVVAREYVDAAFLVP